MIYNPKHFQPLDPEHQLARTLMRENPLATLVSVNDSGEPYLSHLPLHIVQDVQDEPDVQEAPQDASSGKSYAFRLLGHCARANPHWQHLKARPRVWVSFMGPQAYLSPKVYPDLTRVPTWNYLTVLVKAQAHLIDTSEAKDHLLKLLIREHEPAYAQQWQALEASFQNRLLQAIVGFELHIESLEVKFKLNQHRPEAHARMYETYASGDADQKALARWMQRLGMV